MTEKDYSKEAFIREIKGLPPEDEAGAAGAGAGGEGGAGGGEAGAGGAGAGGGGGAGQSDFINRIEASLKIKDPNYVLPEYIRTGVSNGIQLTDEQITAALSKELDKMKVDDPFLAEYAEASSQQGFNREEWLKNKLEEKQFLETKGDDFLRAYFKQIYKEDTDITDEDIEAELNAMTKIAKRELEKDVKQQFKQMGSGQQRQEEPQITDEVIQIQKQIDVGVSSYANSIREKNMIGGFQFSEADRSQFIEELPTFTRKTIREANNRKFVASEADQILTEILIDPKAVLDLLPYLWLKKHKKLDGFFSSAMERSKEEIEKKLGTDPKVQRGVAADQGFDRGKFKADAGK